MTAILEHVVVICLGMLLPRRSYVQVTFGLPYSLTALLSVQKCHACQTYNQKIRSHPAPLHPVVSVGPFAKWGIDFMTCHPHSAGGHGYIIVAVDYFMKWAEAMLTFDNTGKTTALFIFNHVITRFGVPQAIVTDHGSHFRNNMMSELTEKLGLRHDSSTPYYP
jgi:hypothetical protein